MLLHYCIADNYERGQFYEYLPERMNESQPWKGTILPYWIDKEDEVGPQLGSQGFEVEVVTRQTKARQGKRAAKGKRLSLKEQRRMKSSMKKQQWARYREAKDSCYFDVASREELRRQREQPNCFAETDLLPSPYRGAVSEGASFDRPSANVGPLPSLGQIFHDRYSRTCLITKDHREKVIERARKVYHQRCLNRERANHEGCANKLELNRDTEKSDHKEDLTEKAKEAPTLERMKRNKGDKNKVTESDRWTSDAEEDKIKIVRRKKKDKVSKERRKEKRMANKESAKVALRIDALKDGAGNESPEKKCQSLEIIQRDDIEAQREGRHENVISQNRKYLGSNIENVTTELVKAIGK